MVAPLVAALIRHPRHCFWPDAVSLLEPSLVDSDRLLESGQLTDAYLLALAVHHGGQLVTLDQRLNSAAVVGGSEALRLIDP